MFPFDDIVKVTVFLKDLGDVEAMNEIYKRFFPDSGIARAVNYLPARTVGRGVKPARALVQIEAVCSHGDGTPPQAVEARHGLIIEANNIADAPKDELSSQTVAFSHYNNISAQLGVDPATGALVAGGVKAETEQALKNIKAIIESVDHVLEDCVKVNIFVRDMDDMDAVNEVYAQFFPEGTPARRVVGVANLPMGAAIQIDAIFGNFGARTDHLARSSADPCRSSGNRWFEKERILPVRIIALRKWRAHTGASRIRVIGGSCVLRVGTIAVSRWSQRTPLRRGRGERQRRRAAPA